MYRLPSDDWVTDNRSALELGGKIGWSLLLPRSANPSRKGRKGPSLRLNCNQPTRELIDHSGTGTDKHVILRVVVWTSLADGCVDAWQTIDDWRVNGFGRHHC